MGDSHALELDVGAHVRVVNIDLVAAAKERHDGVVHLCHRRRRESHESGRTHGRLEEVPAACGRVLCRHLRAGASTPSTYINKRQEVRAKPSQAKPSRAGRGRKLDLEKKRQEDKDQARKGAR